MKKTTIRLLLIFFVLFFLVIILFINFHNTILLNYYGDEINLNYDNSEIDPNSYYQYNLEIDDYDCVVLLDEYLEDTSIDILNDENDCYEITVELDIDNNPGYAIMSIRCYYDASVLTFKEIKKGKVHPSVDESPVIQNDKYGTYFLVYLDYKSENYTNTGSLANIKFDIIDFDNYNKNAIRFVIQEALDSKTNSVEGIILSSKVVNIEKTS